MPSHVVATIWHVLRFLAGVLVLPLLMFLALVALLCFAGAASGAAFSVAFVATAAVAALVCQIRLFWLSVVELVYIGV